MRVLHLAAASVMAAVAASPSVAVAAPFTSPIHRRRVFNVKGGYTPAETPNATPDVKAWNAAVEARKAARKGQR